MSLIATEGARYSDLVKAEFSPAMAYCIEGVIVNDAAATLEIGAVLGKVTATGKYKVSKADATDGSEVAAAVVTVKTTVPATTDTKVVAMVRGPAILAKQALVLDATIDTDAEKAAVYAALAAKGVLVRDAA